MSVYQIEQYYIHLSFIHPLSDKSVLEAIDLLLGDEGCLDWEFQEEGEYLVVDGFESKSDAEQIENELINLLRGHTKCL